MFNNALSYLKDIPMAEVEIVSPLYETGVHHATVRSPMAGTPPDPLGIMDPVGHTVPQITAGGGDNSDWNPEFPSGGKGNR
jgi:hypothetical protein